MYGYLSQTTYAREVDCSYLTRASTQHPFEFQRCSSIINAQKYSFFLRTVHAWKALCPASVCADSVAAFYSSICNNFKYWRFFSYDL